MKAFGKLSGYAFGAALAGVLMLQISQASLQNYQGAPGVPDSGPTTDTTPGVPDTTTTVDTTQTTDTTSTTTTTTTTITSSAPTKDDLLEKLNSFLKKGYLSSNDKILLASLMTSYTRAVDALKPRPTETAVIGPGESADVQCGSGSDGVSVQFGENSEPGYTSIGGSQRNFTVYTANNAGQHASGAKIRWSLSSWKFGGSLSIEGCNATYTPPTSLGTAYSSSADIYMKVAPVASTTTSTGGEGGPVFAGFLTKKSVLVYGAMKTDTCHDPAGVSASINSVDTTRDVEIDIETPRAFWTYFDRNATVRDGPGMYYVNIYVDGLLYGSRSSNVGACQIWTVKY
ncbi:MAG: hypothetical protein AAB592_00935 [Patescibacteria group bacterium]